MGAESDRCIDWLRSYSRRQLNGAGDSSGLPRCLDCLAAAEKDYRQAYAREEW